MSAPSKQPSVSMSAVAAAGLASATAALLTSRFGVAGTIIGAALTTMIITGGSAILKAYLESVSGKVRRVPGKVRERASRAKEYRDFNQPNLPERPDLRNNFMGRLRGALAWFSNLSTMRKRYILSAALIPAVIAFLIGMGTVTGVELASGKSLSCSVWDNCPAASTTADGTRPSLLGGGPKTDSTDVVEDQQQQIPVDPGAQPATPQQNVAPESPAPADPAAPSNPAAPAPEDPAAQEPAPQDPVVEEPPPEEQAPSDPPASGTPAPVDPSGGAQEPVPSEP